MLFRLRWLRCLINSCVGRVPTIGLLNNFFMLPSEWSHIVHLPLWKVLAFFSGISDVIVLQFSQWSVYDWNYRAWTTHQQNHSCLWPSPYLYCNNNFLAPVRPQWWQQKCFHIMNTFTSRQKCFLELLQYSIYP